MNLNALCAFDIMPYIVDIVIAVVMLIFVIGAAKKGFVNCLFGFISTIVALVAAFSFATLAVQLTGGLFGLEANLETSFINSFSQINGFDIEVDPNADIAELLLEGGIAEVVVNLIGENYALQPGDTLGKIAGTAVAEFAAALIAGIALFLVLKIVFAILKKFFNFIAKGGLLGFLNKILGAAVGLIEAILLASLVVAILSMFPSMMPFLNGSIILTALYNNNPLMWLIALFLM